MENIRNHLTQKIQELTEMIDKAQEYLLTSPPGTLRISHNHSRIQYYWRRTKTDCVGTYINRSNMSLVYELAQKDYANKIVVSASQEKARLEESLKTLPSNISREVYYNLPPNRQILVDPYFPSQHLIISQWLSLKKTLTRHHGRHDLSKLHKEDAIMTNLGERVRSKSEKILADKFHRLDIPYVYECPFYIKNYGYIYPDFTLLNVRTGKEYFWEHLGLMDQVEYVEKTLRKLESYERNHIHAGKSLILSFETKNHPLSSQSVDAKIQEFLL